MGDIEFRFCAAGGGERQVIIKKGELIGVGTEVLIWWVLLTGLSDLCSLEVTLRRYWSAHSCSEVNE